MQLSDWSSTDLFLLMRQTVTQTARRKRSARIIPMNAPVIPMTGMEATPTARN